MEGSEPFDGEFESCEALFLKRREERCGRVIAGSQQKVSVLNVVPWADYYKIVVGRRVHYPS